MSKRHVVSFEVEFDFDLPRTTAVQKVKNWVECNGHTSSGHGFEFLDVVKPKVVMESE